jgi:hypothetical protein
MRFHTKTLPVKIFKKTKVPAESRYDDYWPGLKPGGVPPGFFKPIEES